MGKRKRRAERRAKVIRWLKGKRLGQTIPAKTKRTIVDPKTGRRVTIPAGYYVKGGKLYRYSKVRDRRVKSKHRRSRRSPPWRGDWLGRV